MSALPPTGPMLGPSGAPASAALPTTPTVMVAPAWRRAVAALLDALPLATLWLVITWALVASDPSPPDIPPWNLLDRLVDYVQARPGRTALSLLVLCALQVVLPLVATRTWGATPGKRALGLAVIDASGRTPRAGRLLAWLTLRLPSIALGGVGLWWTLLDVERRTLHDRLAGVWVIVRG